LRAIDLQRKALQTNPRDPKASEWLANHLKILIVAAERLGRAEEAGAARRELAELKATGPAKEKQPR
jgi:hypothetical protein